MTKIYLVRHCEALGNIEHIFQGHTDLDITPLGEKQLERLSQRFSNVNIDRVFSSPLIRAKKTAQALIGEKNILLEIHDGLIEINGGFLEGRPFTETFGVMPYLLDIWLNHPQDFNPEGGEAMTIAYQRIWDTIISIANENKGKSVACASHGGVIRCLNCRLLYNDINQLANTPWSGNTDVTLLKFDDDMNINVAYINDSSHLPEELQNKKSKVTSYIKELNRK